MPLSSDAEGTASVALEETSAPLSIADAEGTSVGPTAEATPVTLAEASDATAVALTMAEDATAFVFTAAESETLALTAPEDEMAVAVADALAPAWEEATIPAALPFAVEVK